MTLRRALLLSALAPLAATARPMVPDDVNALAEIAAPALSPDGADVAYEVRRANVTADKQETHIWLAHWDGGAARQVTGRPGESESHPVFTGDGKYIAFLSDRGDPNGNDQIWLLPRAGGEAEKLSDFPGGVNDFAVAPDGASFAVIAMDPDPAAGDKAAHPIVIDRFYFKQDEDGYLTSRRRHLYLLSRADHHATQLTRGDFDDALPAFAPDGASIAFVSKRGADPDRTEAWAIYRMQAQAGAAARALTDGAVADANPEWESPPAVSPDGKSIAYVHGADPRLIEYGAHQLALIAAAGGAPALPAARLDRNISHLSWSADGKAVLGLVENDGADALLAFDPVGGAVTPLSAAQGTVSAYAQAKGHIVVVESAPDSPPELYALESGALRPLSAANEAWLHDIDLAPVHRLRFPSRDGTDIHGFLATPPGQAPAGKFPTILRIHGGPALQFDLGFRADWQIFAGHGYAVVAANPRGSSGRGTAYSAAIAADWGNLDAQDVLAAVDYAVAHNVADPKRLGVGGWSYGGILTNDVIAQDKRFRVAISGASISNVLAGYGTDEYVRDYENELGRPWQNLAGWEKISFAFLHADRITTPTLFLCGDKDFNVPLQNSEQMYQALRSLGVPTELVIYPGEFHGLKRPSFLADRLRRYLAWYDRFLK